MTRRVIATFLVATAVVVGASCSGDDDDSTAESAQALCDDASTLQSAITSLVSVRSVDDLETTIDDIESAVDSVKGAGSTLKDDVKDDLSTSWDDLKASLESAKDADSLSDALADASAAATDFVDALEQVASDLECS